MGPLTYLLQKTKIILIYPPISFFTTVNNQHVFFFENKNNASSPPISYFTTFNMFFFGKQKNTSILFTTLVSLLERNIKCENYVIVVKCKYSFPHGLGGVLWPTGQRTCLGHRALQVSSFAFF